MKKVKVIFPDGSEADIDESDLQTALSAGAKRASVSTAKSTSMVFPDGSIADISDTEVEGAIQAGAIKKKDGSTTSSEESNGTLVQSARTTSQSPEDIRYEELWGKGNVTVGLTPTEANEFKSLAKKLNKSAEYGILENKTQGSNFGQVDILNNPLGKAKPSTVNISGVPVSIKTPLPAPIPFADGKYDQTELANSLQARINTKTYTQEDVDVVAKSMDVSVSAASAYMDGKVGTGTVIHFNDIKKQKENQLRSTIDKANADLGLGDTFEEVFASPELAGQYIQKIDNLYLAKNKKESIEAGNTFLATNVVSTPMGATVVGGAPSTGDISKEITDRNIGVAQKLKSIISNDIIEKISEDSTLNVDQKVKKIYNLVDSRDKANVEKAIDKRLSPLRYMVSVATGGNTSEDIDLLNSTKANIEFKVNQKLQDKLDYNQALRNSIAEEYATKVDSGEISPQDEKVKTSYAEKLSSIDAENTNLSGQIVTDKALFEKYPVLFKSALADAVNEFNAIKSGNVEGYEEGGYEDTTLPEYLKSRGFDINDQKVQDFVRGDNFKDYSFFGRPLNNIVDVFTNTGKSLVDFTYVRDDATVLAEKRQAELFPTQVGEKDEFKLSGAASTAQNIANTTGQVIGQGLLQFGTAGVGRMVGLSKVAATNAAFWGSGTLTSYDQAYKDSYDFVDSAVGRTAYAGLIALANGASEKIFPEIKLFQIPGVSDAIAAIAQKAGTKEFTKELSDELLGKATNAIVDYGKKYAKNISQETLEEVAVDLVTSGTRFLFGDPNANVASAIENAKNTAIQTVIGTSLIGGFGAHRDVQAERNVSAKSTIYNAAIYHDEALDAINLGFTNKLYNEYERDAKIAVLNTARDAVNVMQKTEQVEGRKLDRPARELYVANLTAEAVLTGQKKGMDEVGAAAIDVKLANLKNQRQQILKGEVVIDEDGNVSLPVAKVDPPIVVATDAPTITEPTPTVVDNPDSGIVTLPPQSFPEPTTIGGDETAIVAPPIVTEQTVTPEVEAPSNVSEVGNPVKYFLHDENVTDTKKPDSVHQLNDDNTIDFVNKKKAAGSMDGYIKPYYDIEEYRGDGQDFEDFRVIKKPIVSYENGKISVTQKGIITWAKETQSESKPSTVKSEEVNSGVVGDVDLKDELSGDSVKVIWDKEGKPNIISPKGTLFRGIEFGKVDDVDYMFLSENVGVAASYARGNESGGKYISKKAGQYSDSSKLVAYSLNENAKVLDTTTLDGYNELMDYIGKPKLTESEWDRRTYSANWVIEGGDITNTGKGLDAEKEMKKARAEKVKSKWDVIKTDETDRDYGLRRVKGSTFIVLNKDVLNREKLGIKNEKSLPPQEVKSESKPITSNEPTTGTTNQSLPTNTEQSKGQVVEAAVPGNTTSTDSSPTATPTTVPPVTPKLSDKVRGLAATIREKGITPDFLKVSDPTINIKGIGDKQISEALATALDFVADAMDAGTSLSKAISDSFAQFKKAYTDNDIPFDEPKLKKGFTEYVREQVGATGIIHAETAETREEFGLPEYGKEGQTFAGWDAEADVRIKNGEMPSLMKKLRGGDMPTAVEVRMLGKHIAYLKGVASNTKSNEDIGILHEAIKLSDRISGTETARGLVARKGLFGDDGTLADFFQAEMESAVVDELTDEQKIQVEKEHTEIAEAQKRWDAEKERLNKEINDLKAQKEIDKNKPKSPPKERKTHEDFVQERQAIVQHLKEKLRQVRSGTNVTIIPYAADLFAAAPDVARLVKSLVEEGVIKLGDVIDNIHDTLKDGIPDITKDDVRDLVAGVYNAPQKTKTETTRELVELKMEAKLINQLIALQSGEVPATNKQQIERNQRIKDLREQIAKFRKELITNEDKLRILKSRYESEIKKVEADLKSGNFLTNPPKPTPLQLDKEAKAAKEKLVKLKMERQLRLIKQQQQNMSKRDKAIKGFAEILNIPRTLMTIVDYSAVLRQGAIQAVSHPGMVLNARIENGRVKIGGAGVDMIKAGVSQNVYDNWFFDLKETPRFELMEASGLGITDSTNPLLSAREEGFMSNLAERIPIIGKSLKIGDVTIPGTNLVKGSERSYSMFINKLRVDVFNRFADAMEERGLTFENSPEQFKQMAEYVNNGTGRGSLGKTLNRIAPLLNGIFFSPRLIASRLNMLTYLAQPRFYDTVPKEVRVAYFKDMAKFIGVGMMVLGLFSMNDGGEGEEDDVTVETDPRSSDFGKIKQGNTRWDIWGGFQPFIRVAAQILTGERKSTNSGEIFEITGDGPFGKTRADVLFAFGRGKLAPVPGMAIDLFSGRTAIGEKVMLDKWGKENEGEKEITIDRYLKEHLLPLTYTGLEDAVKDMGVKSLFSVGVPSIFGVGTQTFEPSVASNQKIIVYKNGKKRDSTPEEFLKYQEEKIKSKAQLLETVQKSGVYLNKYGDVTTEKTGKKKKYALLDDEEKKDLEAAIARRASYLAKKKLKLNDK